MQAEWEGQHGQEHCVSPPPNLHPTDHHACSLPPPLAPPPRPHHHCACGAAATTHRHCSAENVWTTAPCRNKTPGAAIRAHSEGRKVPGPLPTSPCPHYVTCCATCLPACLSVPATLYMLLTDPPACRPTDRTTHVPTHLSTGHSLLHPPPHTHTHTQPKKPGPKRPRNVPGKRGKRTVPVYMASVFYAVDETKTEIKLSAKTYGPAQCTIGDVKVGGRLEKNSYSPGWVFLGILVPTEPTVGLVESDPAAPAAPNDWGGGAGSSTSSEQTTANQDCDRRLEVGLCTCPAIVTTLPPYTVIGEPVHRHFTVISYTLCHFTHRCSASQGGLG